jgi:membrane protein YqaA with SNARE-associated domain
VTGSTDVKAIAAILLKVPWAKFGGWLLKAKLWIVAVLKPFGLWGLLGLSLVDSAAIPLPFLDPLVVSYGVGNHAKMVIYCMAAAVGSAIGSMLPYYLGRAGGELFLLKRINRQRYERMRDRFEKQEFLAIMLPAMCPPPMPVKIFELGAGVFEMRVSSYFLAICSGKFLRFLIESILVIVYGEEILTSSLRLIRRHSGLLTGFAIAAVLIVLAWIVRKIFDRRAARLPIEDEVEVGPGDAV